MCFDIRLYLSIGTIAYWLDLFFEPLHLYLDNHVGIDTAPIDMAALYTFMVRIESLVER